LSAAVSRSSGWWRDICAAGAAITTLASNGEIPQASDLLFRVNPNGTLIPATLSGALDPQPGDTLVLLGQGENRTSE
jgi:hypothetical protein